VVTGTGLVLLVIPVVKSVILPTTFPEKFCTPVTIDAAKSAPGSLGMEIDGVPPEGRDAVVDGWERYIGS
jgi:hypothetical protein